MNFNSPLYSGFVHPQLCKELWAAGLTPHTAYHYRELNGRTIINTYAFDRDDYYAEGDKLLDATADYYNILPAYSIGDIEKILPGNYLLNHTATGYEVMMDDLYSIPQQKAERLPDVFAMVLLQGIKQRILNLEYVNPIINAH